MTHTAAQIECVACGASLASAEPVCSACGAAMFLPQRRFVTVLFADLAGYTQLCAELDPEEVHLLIRPVMNALCRTCQDFGGVVPAIPGDGLMAAFGARSAHEHDPLRAIATAARLQRIVAERRAAYERIPELRVGINAGEVLVAPSWEAGGVTLSGDAVNVGQRLCASAPPGGILVADEVARLAPTVTDWYGEERRTLRNRPVAVGTRLLDWTALPEQLPTARLPGTTPLVGRVDETARLDELLTGPAGGCSLLLLGEPGVGKTRLVDSWAADFAQRRVLWVGCPSFGSSELAPLRELVVSALTDPASEEALHRLDSSTRRRVRRLAGGAANSSDSDSEEDLVQAGVAFLAALAELSPLIVVVDDVHWAAPPVLDALSRLAVVSSARLALVAMSRAEGQPDLPLPRVTVSSLTEDDAEALIQRLLPGAPASLLALVRARAGGNPLFIEHCVNLLVEEGTVVIDDAGCHVADPGALHRIPTSMRLFVGARLDLLTSQERAAVGAAATLGDHIALAALAHLVPGTRVAVDQLVDRGFLRWRTADDAAPGLEFAHALVRDVAYESQTRSVRVAAHRASAAWYLTQPDPDAIELRAAHLEAALALRGSSDADCALVRETFEALVALAESGVAERFRHSCEVLDRAATLLSRYPHCELDPLRFWLMVSQTASTAGDHERALEAAESATELARARGAEHPRAEAELLRGRALEVSDVPRAAAAYRAAGELFRELGDNLGAARAALGQAHCVESVAGLRPAITALQDAHALAAERSRPIALLAAQELALLCYVDGPYVVNGWVEAVASALEREDELVRARQSLAGAAVALHQLDVRGAERLAAEVVRDATDVGDANALLNGILIQLEAQVLGGAHKAAELTLRRCFDLAATRPTRRTHVGTVLISSLLHLRRGDAGAAELALAEAAPEAEQLGAYFVRDLAAFRAYAALDSGRFDEAVTQATLAADVDRGLDHPFPSLRPRLAALAASVAARRPPPFDATRLRADAVLLGSPEIDAVAARWLTQQALLEGQLPQAADPAAPDLAEARALDLENDALRRHEPDRFLAAAQVWSELGVTVWHARALLWHAQTAGDETSGAAGRATLMRLRAPAGLEVDLRRQLAAVW